MNGWEPSPEIILKEFERLDHEEKPINAGVTIYRGKPDQGGNGRLVLEAYNLNLYSGRNFQTP